MQFMSDGIRGFQLAFRGAAFLRQHRSLWRWAFLPALVNLIVFAVAFTVYIWLFSDIYALATGFIHLEAPKAWYGWIWVAPLRFLAWLIGALLLVASLAVLYLAFLLLGTAIASPFLDVLAQRVEAIVTGHVSEERVSWPRVLRSFTASLVLELKKIGFFLAIQVVLFLLGLLIPPLLPFTVIAATLFTILFLPMEYASFAMDHRQLHFAQRRQLIWQHRWLMLGFGTAAFFTLLIPLLNFICLPILVVGGTLLFLHTENTSHAEGARQEAE